MGAATHTSTLRGSGQGQTEDTLCGDEGLHYITAIAGITDPIVSPRLPEQLPSIFESGGADVSLFWHDGGHELGEGDLIAAKRWLSHQAATRITA